MAPPDLRALKDDANRAVADRKWKKALEAYWQLEKGEPDNGLWPQKSGEMQRKLDRFTDAIGSFTRSADTYARTGFLVKAIAVCKLILEIDPGHTATQAKLATLGARQRSGDFQGTSTSMTPRPASITPSSFSAEGTRSNPSPPLETPAGSRPGRLAPALMSEEVSGLTSRPTGITPMPTGIGEPPSGSRLPGLPPTPRPAALRPSLLDDPPFFSPSPGGPGAPAARELAPAPIPVRAPAPPPVPLELELELEPMSSSTTDVGMGRRPPTPMANDSLAMVVPDAHTTALADDSEIEVLEIPLEEVEEIDDEFDSFEVSVGGPDEPTSAVVAAESVLPKTALFSALQPQQLQRLIQVVRLVRLSAGDVLFRRGDPGDALYVVSEGEVEILGPDDKTSFRTLGDGAFFGEIALLTDQPRMATVRALTDSRLLAIDRTMVQELIDSSPEIPKILLRFVRDRLVDTLIAENPLFMPFSPEERKQLAERFRFLELEAGQKIMEEGKRAPGLFVFLSGRAIATLDGKPFMDLGPGDLAGEIFQGPAVATVETMTRTLALELPRAELTDVIMTHPQVLEFVSTLADDRKLLLESWQRGEIEYRQKRVGVV